ncbi:MAG: hypothetical protein ACK4VW_02375 [Anaerolineales bacterium]
MDEALDFRVEKAWLVLNRVPDGRVPSHLQAEIEKIGALLLGSIPNDEQLLALKINRRTLTGLEEAVPSQRALMVMLESIL